MTTRAQEPPAATQIPPLRVDVVEAARIIGVSRRQLFRLIKSSRIGIKEGRRRLFTVEELRSFVQRQEGAA